MNYLTTPTKQYPFRMEEGKVSCDLTPSFYRVRDAVYEIGQIDKKSKRYVGKTTKVPQRLRQHLSAVRHPESGAGQSKIAKAVRKNPVKFALRVYSRNPDQTLDEQEKVTIAAKRAIDFGYNTNQGGGGGGAIASSSSSSSKPPISNPATVTPEKYYPVGRTQTGKVKTLLSPTVKKVQSVCYVFKHRLTGCRLIGRTEQKVAKRVSQYDSSFNGSSKLPLAEAVRKSPEEFVFGIYPDSSPSDEARIIAAKKSNTPDGGFNQNRGGGGSASSKG
jgi:hypothetical protein